MATITARARMVLYLFIMGIIARMEQFRRELQEKLTENPLIYVTRDIDNAMGIDLVTPGYYCVSNEGEQTRELVGTHPEHVFLVQSDEMLDTFKLLEQPKTLELAKDIPNSKLLVFKGFYIIT